MIVPPFCARTAPLSASVITQPPFPATSAAGYPIPINFNDERGQFNTSWTHCSKLVSNKSYTLVTEKCMTQISVRALFVTPWLPIPLPPFFASCIPMHTGARTQPCTLCITVREHDIVSKRDQNTRRLSSLPIEITFERVPRANSFFPPFFLPRLLHSIVFDTHGEENIAITRSILRLETGRAF